MPVEKARILVIDDEKVIRDSCNRIFSSEGYEVRSAENGDRGLELFREFHPDLVLVDLKMPGKSGTEVLKDREGRAKCSQDRNHRICYGSICSRVNEKGCL